MARPLKARNSRPQRKAELTHDDRDSTNVRLGRRLLCRAEAHRQTDLAEGPGSRRLLPCHPVGHRRRGKTLHRQGGTSFTYITSGIHSAIEQARAAANGKNVAIAGGGTLLRQVITLGLLDELELHIVPVILGNGMRLLGLESGLDNMEGIELTPARVIAASDVTHIRYTVNGRRPLVSITEDATRNPPPPTRAGPPRSRWRRLMTMRSGQGAHDRGGRYRFHRPAVVDRENNPEPRAQPVRPIAAPDSDCVPSHRPAPEQIT